MRASSTYVNGLHKRLQESFDEEYRSWEKTDRAAIAFLAEFMCKELQRIWDSVTSQESEKPF